MAEDIEVQPSQELVDVHKHYMDIINCMPNAVYWIDLNCKLQGYNDNFVKLLGIEEINDFSGTPYELLRKYAFWPDSRIDELKLDDMGVIFSEKSKHNVEESPVELGPDKDLYYLSTRVPLLDNNKKVNGLVVVLIDIEDNQQNRQQNNKKLSQDLTLLDRRNGRAPRVLMVEDNLIAQKVEHNLMTSLGCDVDVADSGESALGLFAPGKYDVVLMDIGLQDTSGYIVSKKLREKEEGTGQHVPIIALTSYQAEVVVHDCRDYFMAGVITKPLTMDQAQKIIQHYIYNQNVVINDLVST
ncbi:MAG: response regulator [Legionellaceae bacterium]|nr:response regulator [Legionellaceae bacterium]